MAKTMQVRYKEQIEAIKVVKFAVEGLLEGFEFRLFTQMSLTSKHLCSRYLPCVSLVTQWL